MVSTGHAAAGRPRDPDVDRRIAQAALDLFADAGWAGFAMESVARRARVSKASLYLRWSSKEALLTDALTLRLARVADVDTGTLRGDLIAALTAWIRAVTETPMGPMLTGLIAEAQHDRELRAAWGTRIIEPLRVQHRIMLGRAVARGEIPASTDQEVVLDLFFGAAQHRLLLGHLPLTGEFIGAVVDMILDGIRPR